MLDEYVMTDTYAWLSGLRKVPSEGAMMLKYGIGISARALDWR